ncbi:hypothetical protein DTL21_18750 [Bremerella cremea]|uniref:DUF4013 domain-containing protein n=1 Tax=Blastopirellula marina TaxID=124 RepID=A0A2S8FJA5_9BACT|nr:MULTISPECIES: hypothetical protein [Pirellulaceae]PQO32265.1 hypothetical protein C5Y83_18730 [Blastopirellula marina]RCS45332.1 hypothetical protein DTL21_18750 [Bremerella cremea]
MTPNDVYLAGAIAAPVLVFGLFAPIIVWLSLMLLSPDTLDGLFEQRLIQVRGIRFRFAKFLLRVFLGLLAALATVLAVIFLFAMGRVVEIGLLVSSLILATWWLYLLGGSIVYAWQILDVLGES